MTDHLDPYAPPTVVCYRCPRELVRALLEDAEMRLRVREAPDVAALLEGLREDVVDLVVADASRLDLEPERLVGVVRQVAQDVGVVLVAEPLQARVVGRLLREGLAWSLPLATSDPELVGAVEALAVREAERHAGRRRSQDWASWMHATRRGLDDLVHELRTPVSIVQGYVANLLDGLSGPLEPPQREALARVKAATELLVALAGNFRERLPAAGDPASTPPEARRLGRRQLDVKRLCEDAVALFRPQAEEAGLRLTCLVERDVPRVWGDRARLTQLLVNLLSNALRLTPRGGAVTVTAEPTHVRSRAGCRIRVRDTGPGVAPEARDRCFERGWSADPSRPGLGLAIGREIATEHRGELRLVGGEGVGACFELRLPADARRRPVAVRLVDDPELAEAVLLRLCMEQAPPRRLEADERDVDVLVGRLLDGAATLVIGLEDEAVLTRVLGAAAEPE